MGHEIPRYWKALVKIPTDKLGPEPEAAIQMIMDDNKCSREEALKIADDYAKSKTYYTNNLYQVQVDELSGGLVHINVRRRDGAPVHDWRHLQQIKNEILGEDCEAVELYPAESRKVDASNKYHLWGMRDPTWRVPIGFQDRDVQDSKYKEPGMRQRPL